MSAPPAQRVRVTRQPPEPARQRHRQRHVHGRARSARQRRRLVRLQRRTVLGRHPVRTALLVVLVALTPVWVSLGEALGNPGLGSSMPARGAEWFREHGFNGVVNWAENLWYSHHAPPLGGLPPKGAIPAPSASGGSPAGSAAGSGSAASGHSGTGSRGATSGTSGLVALPAPQPIVPLARPALPGEGDWHAVGRLVDGHPALYEAFLRPDAVHTSLVAGVAWMDTRLLRAQLYSGSMIPGPPPGGGAWPYTAPISASAADSLVAAFNAGFLMKDAEGGYYTDGRTMIPLRSGAASFVVYKNGDATVGAWGSDVRMTPQVASVRQNLDLLVENGTPVPGLNPNDTTKWGFTLGNAVYVWRSGVGVTANGALVYVAGPGLNITTLADLLARAGAVRAMELDINTDWVGFSSYQPATPAGAATPANGTELLAGMSSGPDRWFQAWWPRDFITMSARSVALGAPSNGKASGASGSSG